jgi:hypothetical protein
VKIGNYSFAGPYDSADFLENRSGVYAILCLTNGKYQPVDCGETASVKSRIENHERYPCWQRSCSGTLMVAVYYTPRLQSAGRCTIEQEIRALYNFPCGQR